MRLNRMASVQHIIIQGPVAPFTGQEHEQINRIVQEGFNRWNDFHERFSAQQREIRQQDPGLAGWDDVRNFVLEHGGGSTIEGFSAQKFKWNAGTIDAFDEPITVVSLGKINYYCGDFGGAPVLGPNGETVAQIGLNIPSVAELLRRHCFPETASGAAHLRWNKNAALPSAIKKTPFAAFIYLQQTVQADPSVGFAEQSTALHCYVATQDRGLVKLEGADKTLLCRDSSKAPSEQNLNLRISFWRSWPPSRTRYSRSFNGHPMTRSSHVSGMV
jgi:hypothetical protein